MSQSSFNYNPRNLTPEQQRLITMYINQYNQTNTHIDMLLDMLDEIRGNIINVINTTQPRRTRINRHNRYSNTNTGLNRIITQLFNDRQNNYIHYDYNNPINPSIYNEYNTFNNLRNRRNEYFDMSYNNLYSTNNSIPTQNSDLANFLSNFLNSTVVVRPTNDQIQNASRVIRYGDIDNPLSESCPISLDEFNDDDQVRQLLPCGHLFHQNQFQEWFENNVRCPVCRYDIRNYRPLSRRNTPNNYTSEQTPDCQAASSSTTSSSSTSTPILTPTNPTPTNPIENINRQNVSSESNINRDNTNTPPLSNINVVRDPISNQIDQLTFDITNPDFTNNFLDQMARNIFQSMLNPRSQNTNDRFMIDPSNNILFYETIIRPNINQNEDNNESNN
jgi:hypothetical protein